MPQGFERNIVFMLIKDECLTCAMGLERAEEPVTDDAIESLNERGSLESSNWPEAVKAPLKEAFGCPLGLVCYPSCFWWQDGECTFPRRDK